MKTPDYLSAIGLGFVVGALCWIILLVGLDVYRFATRGPIPAVWSWPLWAGLAAWAVATAAFLLLENNLEGLN